MGKNKEFLLRHISCSLFVIVDTHTDLVLYEWFNDTFGIHTLVICLDSLTRNSCNDLLYLWQYTCIMYTCYFFVDIRTHSMLYK
jgi:hypothetical protein